MYPDGGIARFRAYGVVQPIWLPLTSQPHPWDLRPSSKLTSVLGGLFGSEEKREGEIDLAHAFNGGRCVFESDTHYGVGANLLLPGRGVDMGECLSFCSSLARCCSKTDILILFSGDGWETKRSRTPNHKDYVIIKLSVPHLAGPRPICHTDCLTLPCLHLF